MKPMNLTEKIFAGHLVGGGELPTAGEVAPVEIQDFTQGLRDGIPPRELMLAGRIAPEALEMVVIDMIRRGVVADMVPYGKSDE